MLINKIQTLENEAEDAVAKIKERQMGRLFENVTMDIQAERRNTAEARAELTKVEKELEAAWQERDSAQQERDSAQQERDSAQQERDIYKHILHLTMQHVPNTEILASLLRRFNLTEEQAEKRLEEIL